ncbi:tetratricopeptide repeat protein [Bacteroidales bacterium AH-315-I05]|nr:tetratricopeptide repeat protein [Bacteroidales bacterium AH-315-I05]
MNKYLVGMDTTLHIWVLLFIVATLCTSDVTGQNQQIIDSLKNKLEKAKEDTNKVNILNALSSEQAQSNYQKSLEFAIEALSLSEVLGFKKGKGNSLNNIGVAHYKKGNYNESIEYFLDALKIREKIKDEKGIAAIYNNIGGIYTNQGDYKKAADHFESAMQLFEHLNDKKGIASCANNLGLIAKSSGDYESVMRYYLISLQLEYELDNKMGVAITLSNIGDVYFEIEEYEEAKDYYLQALTFYDILGNLPGAASILLKLGSVSAKNINYSQAIEYFNEAIKLAKKADAKDIIKNCYKEQYEIYSEREQYKEALETYEKFVHLKDSLNFGNKLAELENKYESEKQLTLQKAGQEKQKVIAEAENERQRIVIYSTIACLLLIIAFAFLTFKRLRITQRQKVIIEKQKHTVDEKNKEITDSIKYAQGIQQAILPSSKLMQQCLPEHFVLFKPKDVVSGDFYWIAADKADNSIYFAAVDCTGHGVPGAFVSMVGANALNRCVKEYGISEPAKILDKLTKLVEETFRERKDGMDMALCSLQFTDNGSRLQYAGANNPLYIIRNQEVLETKADKQPIGAYAEKKPFTNHLIELQKDDVVYVFSDGYPDQFGGPKSKKFKHKKLKELLLSIQKKPMNEQKEKLNKTIEEWKGDLEQVDDICIFGIRV